MKRFLWLMCLCSTAALGVGCGDDDGGGETGDGGVSLGSLDDRLNDLDENLNNLGGDLGNLGGQVDMLGSDLDDLSGNVDDIDSRLTDLETPKSCSEGDVCVPDGLDLLQEGVEPLVAALCEYELGCCTDGELQLLWGAGITSVDQCVALFMTMVDNGLRPDFLDVDSIVDEGVLGYIIELAHALNSGDIKFGLNAEGVAECVEHIEARECYDPEAEPEEEPTHCDPDQEPEDDPCAPENLIAGGQQEGERCGDIWFNVCAEGLVCRWFYGSVGYQGICATPAEEGDGCVDDDDCDPWQTDLYCNQTDHECQERGDAGDDCSYIDPYFLMNDWDFNPYFDEGLLQNPFALSRECKRGLACDPESNTCVAWCDEGWICSNNVDCPEGMTCNFTLNENLRDTWSLGTCRDALEEGDACTTGSECASARCDFGVSNLECQPALKEIGDDCTTDVAGVGNYDSTCESGYCAADDTDSTDGKCAERCSEQADCPDTHFCQTTEYVDANYGTEVYACDLKRADGADCISFTEDGNPFDNFQCANGFCNSTTGNCEAKSATCATAQHSACTDGNWCNAGTCEAFEGDGNACPAGNHAACGPGQYCASGTNTCADRADPGEDCPNGQEQCNPYLDVSLTCTTGSVIECHPYGDYPVGANCVSDHNICRDKWCSGGVCTEPLDEGDDCNVEADRCKAGLFCEYDLDEDPLTGDGTCQPQHGIGESCDYRYGGDDCLGNDCELYNDSFVCGPGSSEEPLTCGYYGPVL